MRLYNILSEPLVLTPEDFKNEISNFAYRAAWNSPSASTLKFSPCTTLLPIVPGEKSLETLTNLIKTSYLKKSKLLTHKQSIFVNMFPPPTPGRLEVLPLLC
uniref:hypothetical protein n=1 Tax=Hydrocytium acuminatum TaxID=1745963 RepID=UPI002A83B602|nr:hypothetical protein UYM18_pgp040 [Hydrocytium acuminatum]WOR09577.1 hypothetical protein [Hydrocytium acuminatum]